MRHTMGRLEHPQPDAKTRILDAAARRWKSHHPLALFPSQTVGAALDGPLVAEQAMNTAPSQDTTSATVRPFRYASSRA